MKKTLIALLLTLLAVPSWAQITHTDKGAIDENANKILKAAAKKFNSGAVSFNVTLISKDADKKETARMKADVLYSQGRYRATTEGNAIYCDSTSVSHWNQETNEVVVNGMSDAEDNLMNPAAILNNYQKNFRAKFIRQETDGNAVIDMTPKSAKSYHKIRLIVGASSGLLKRMEMHNYDGTCGEFVISNFKSGVAATDADFTFPKSKHPGAEIIDMR